MLDFDLEEVDLVFLKKSQGILAHAEESFDKLFFFTPWWPHLPFPVTRSRARPRLDHTHFIFEMDHIVGELMKTLEQHDLAKNTPSYSPATTASRCHHHRHAS